MTELKIVVHIISSFCFSVMLSAGLCHLLAEALPEIQAKVKNFPLGTFLCAAGYMLTLVADEIGASLSGHNHHCHSSSSFRENEQGRGIPEIQHGCFVFRDIPNVTLLASICKSKLVKIYKTNLIKFNHV